MSVWTKLSRAGALVAILAVPSTAGAEEVSATFRAPLMTIHTSAMPRPACAPAKPFAPEQALVMGLTGTVLVEYTVHANGHVGEIALDKSTAHPALAEAVRSWLGGCAFTPALARGHAISLRVIQPYTFKRG